MTDPHDRRGRRNRLVGLVPLYLLAILAARPGPEAIAQLGRLGQKRLRHALGFYRGNTPCADRKEWPGVAFGELSSGEDRT